MSPISVLRLNCRRCFWLQTNKLPLPFSPLDFFFGFFFFKKNFAAQIIVNQISVVLDTTTSWRPSSRTLTVAKADVTVSHNTEVSRFISIGTSTRIFLRLSSIPSDPIRIRLCLVIIVFFLYLPFLSHRMKPIQLQRGKCFESLTCPSRCWPAWLLWLPQLPLHQLNDPLPRLHRALPSLSSTREGQRSYYGPRQHTK